MIDTLSLKTLAHKIWQECPEETCRYESETPNLSAEISYNVTYKSVTGTIHESGEAEKIEVKESEYYTVDCLFDAEGEKLPNEYAQILEHYLNN